MCSNAQHPQQEKHKLNVKIALISSQTGVPITSTDQWHTQQIISHSMILSHIIIQCSATTTTTTPRHRRKKQRVPLTSRRVAPARSANVMPPNCKLAAARSSRAAWTFFSWIRRSGTVQQRGKKNTNGLNGRKSNEMLKADYKRHWWDCDGSKGVKSVFP